tara:strand:- start:153 stop:446 length:294 start_codon:yes stop_codon:yes gene_type:complete
VDSILAQITDLKKKMSLLASRYVNVKERNVGLENDKVVLIRKVQGLENEIKELRKRVEVVDVAKGISLENSDSVSFARTRVNSLIRDIDKCIVLLNE